MAGFYFYLRIIVIIVVAVFVLDILRMFITFAIASSKVNTYFESRKKNADLKVLFVGDSIINGNGATSPDNTLAGRFSKNYPDADTQTMIIMTAKELAKTKLPEGKFDLIVISTGGNDMIGFSRIDNIVKNTKIILEKARERSDLVILLHSDDIGKAPIFSPLTSWFLFSRSERLRKGFEAICKETGSNLVYVQVDGENRFYAKDKAHPNDAGYKLWYDKILQELRNQKFGD